MNSIQNYGISKNNAIMFKASTKPIGEAVENVASKSGIYQAAVDKLAALQSEIEYGCFLLRQIPHNWCNPDSASEPSRAICKQYHAKIEELTKEKKKIIAEMVDPLLQQEKYKGLPKGYRERIINDEEAGSTWRGYFFNEKELDQRIAKMKEWDRTAPEREAKEQIYKQAEKTQYVTSQKLNDLYNSEAAKRRNAEKVAFNENTDFTAWFEQQEQSNKSWDEFCKKISELNTRLWKLNNKNENDIKEIENIASEVERLTKNVSG